MSDQTDDAVVRYGVKELLALQGETLKRIESKVDAGNTAQAETNAKFDLRLSLVESLDLEKRLGSLEKFRWSFPSIAALSLISTLALLALYLVHWRT